MLSILGSQRGLTRRAALSAGGLAIAGAALGSTKHKAKHVVVIYLLGGAATQDMVDLKPDAPKEVRGDFKPIATSAPGVMISDQLPRLAKWMHKACVIRSTTHKAGCHNPMPSYCGSEQALPDIVSTSDSYPPSMGSVIEHLRQHGPRATRDLPDYVYLPCYLGWGQAIRRPGPYAGWLGKSCDALYTECKPSLDEGKSCSPGQPQFVRGAPFLPEAESAVAIDRLDGRKTLLSRLESKARAVEKSYSRQQSRAFQLLTSSKVRAAFDIGKEPPALRDAYGRTMFGSSVLIARRLIEAGVRFVNATWDIYWDRHRIDYDAWDTHTRNFMILKDWNLPQFDRTLSAFMADLDTRGLLDETLVLVTSEMGRTPKINANAGRDHWTHCYSTLLAGGGIKGGTVVGASDAQAAYVKDRPVRPADVCATVYRALGLDHTMMLPDRSGRPNSIDHGGEPIREALA